MMANSATAFNDHLVLFMAFPFWGMGPGDMRACVTYAQTVSPNAKDNSGSRHPSGNTLGHMYMGLIYT